MTTKSARANASRPVSPHLQIWGWTVTMATSITHRATGMALYSGTILLALWIFALAFHPALFAVIAGLLASPIGVIVLAGYTWALLFHLMNGLRFLYWDSGRGMAPKTATMTSWLVYIASLILAAIIVWAGISARGAL